MLLSFACSIPGKMHVERNIPGQDFSTFRRVRRGNDELVICAVADGVGSCSYSQYGSEAAVTVAVDFLSKKLAYEGDTSEVPAMDQLVQEAFYAAKDASTIDLMEKMERPMTSFCTTLTLAVYADGAMWYGHCGDGGIIVLYTDGTYEMITSRHKGEEISSVYPISEETEWEFGFAPKEVASLAMMTDGILDHYVPMFPVTQQLYYPALKPVLQPRFDDDREIPEGEIQQYAEGRSDAMRAYMLEKVFPVLQEEGVTDDLSYAAIIDYERACGVPNIKFDKEQWNSEMKAHYDRLRELLRQPFPPAAEVAETQEVATEPKDAPVKELPVEGMPTQDAPNGESPIIDDSVDEPLAPIVTPEKQTPLQKLPNNRRQPSNKVSSKRLDTERLKRKKPQKEAEIKKEIVEGAQVALRVLGRMSCKAGNALRVLSDKLSKCTDDEEQ